MSFRDRMKKKRKDLQKRHNEQSKKNAGGRFPTIFDKSKIPPGVDFYRVTEGEHIIDILPWVAGSNMPLGEDNEPITEEGGIEYVLDLWVHTNIGAMGNPYVCPYENFGEPCPICEYLKEERREKHIWNKLRARRRVVYLIWAHTNRDQEKKGVQILEVSHFFMEEKIAEIAKLPRGGGSIVFSDPDEGKSIMWTRKGTGQDNTQYLGHRLIDREVEIPDKILDSGFALDEVVKMRPTYDEINKDFRGTLKSIGVDDAEEEEFDPIESSTGDDVPLDLGEKKPRKKKVVRKVVKKPTGKKVVRKPVRRKRVKR